jgi:cytochrome c
MRKIILAALTVIFLNVTEYSSFYIKTAHSSEILSHGEGLYKKYHCAICHGAKGNYPVKPSYPKLGGQNKAYLFNQTKDIRDGVRENGQSRLMRPLVKNITDKEIEKIAAFLANSPN